VLRAPLLLMPEKWKTANVPLRPSWLVADFLRV
jgi:hypothetical protein